MFVIENNTIIVLYTFQFDSKTMSRAVPSISVNNNYDYSPEINKTTKTELIRKKRLEI